MTFLTDLRRGVAQLTAAGSGGVLTYRPTGAYEAAEAGIYGAVLPEAPVRALALSVYPVAPGAVEPVFGVQFRFRAGSDGQLDAIEEAVHRAWGDWAPGDVGGVRVLVASLSSAADLGQDAGGRLARSVNYYLTAHRPGEIPEPPDEPEEPADPVGYGLGVYGIGVYGA